MKSKRQIHRTRADKRTAGSQQRMVVAHPFKWKKLRQLKDGYGNRHALICNGCSQILIQCDWGNGPGQRWVMIDAERACKKHTRKCEKVRSLTKALRNQMRYNDRTKPRR